MKYLLVVLLSCFLYTNAYAQKIKLKVDENTVVKDSSGLVYPYVVWRVLLRQGDFDLQPIDDQDEKTDFLLVKLTEEQKNRRLEKLPKPEESKFFKTGSYFAAFRTSDLNNQKINLKEEKGKIFVINFWFVNCPPCQMEIPALNQLVADFKGNENVRFIAVALDDKYNLSEFLKRSHFDYNIIDNGRYLADKYSIRSFPTHVIVNQDGKVYFHTTGLAINTVFWLKKSINELLSTSAVSR